MWALSCARVAAPLLDKFAKALNMNHVERLLSGVFVCVQGGKEPVLIAADALGAVATLADEDGLELVHVSDVNESTANADVLLGEVSGRRKCAGHVAIRCRRGRSVSEERRHPHGPFVAAALLPEKRNDGRKAPARHQRHRHNQDHNRKHSLHITGHFGGDVLKVGRC